MGLGNLLANKLEHPPPPQKKKINKTLIEITRFMLCW